MNPLLVYLALFVAILFMVKPALAFFILFAIAFVLSASWLDDRLSIWK